MSSEKRPRLLDQVRQVMRRRHYSLSTERSYCDWIKRFVQYHRMTSRDDLHPAEPKIEAFLTFLAMEQNVSSSTQNQAMNALVFLYKRVLQVQLSGTIDAARSNRAPRIPVALSKEETGRIIALMDRGVPQLIVKLMYGSGLRIMEAVRLRVHDLDFSYKQITVRSGKGGKDRVTPLAEALPPLLENQLALAKALHEQDLARGYGNVYLPAALSRKYPRAAWQWEWQYAFPARNLAQAGC